MHLTNLRHFTVLCARQPAGFQHKSMKAQARSNRQYAGGKKGERFKLVLVVAAALLDDQGKVLLAQRPAGKKLAGLWEFPGGKVEDGETPEQALARELKEELNIEVELRHLKPLTFASVAYPDQGYTLLMPLYVCWHWSGSPQGLEGQQLSWVASSELPSYEMPPADLPLVVPVQQAMAAGEPAEVLL
ncbi:hypothetical protein WJX72_010469 [[Myrmecia] bisecta]|uniref:8-oxo-dGTP diphosphatase n=1 Tax=[Myrmecia] bisecta TaxID=41462 RepID=A0AAW1QG60_9CHLO